MKYRHEYKHIINAQDAAYLISKLNLVMRHDNHTNEKGEYFIRSLYFDNFDNICLEEKKNGALVHEKFRIRFYNMDPSYIMLEKKIRNNSLSHKDSTKITKEEVERIINGDYAFLRDSGDRLKMELYVKMHNRFLRPKTIVDYMRTAFVYDVGNVRVTIDQQIRSGMLDTSLFDTTHSSVCVDPSTIIFEVKYDAFLPDFIRDMIQLNHSQTSSFSKYAYCRTFDNN